MISYNLVSDRCDFMKPILGIYDYVAVMHMKFRQDILSNIGVIAL